MAIRTKPAMRPQLWLRTAFFAQARGFSLLGNQQPARGIGDGAGAADEGEHHERDADQHRVDGEVVGDATGDAGDVAVVRTANQPSCRRRLRFHGAIIRSRGPSSQSGMTPTGSGWCPMVRRGPLWDHAEAMAPRDRLRLGTMHRGEDRLIAGVCSGIAEALHVDPIIVRTAFIILTIAGGFGIPLYLGLWFLMREPDGTRGINLDGWICRAATFASSWPCACWSAGTLLLLRELGLWFSDALVWPLTLAGLGVALLVGADRRGRAGAADAARPTGFRDGRSNRSSAGWQSALRLGLGAVLVLAGLGAFLAANDALGGGTASRDRRSRWRSPGWR